MLNMQSRGHAAMHWGTAGHPLNAEARPSPFSFANDVLVVDLLLKAAAGQVTYRPRDRRVATLREFQLMVEAAQFARDFGLMDVSFPTPSKGKVTAGLITGFTVIAVTPKGVERLSGLVPLSCGREQPTRSR